MPVVLLLQALRKRHATIIRRDTAVILHTAIPVFLQRRVRQWHHSSPQKTQSTISTTSTTLSRLNNFGLNLGVCEKYVTTQPTWSPVPAY